MKCSVEYCHVRHGGEEPPHLADAGDIHRVVQGRERIEFFHLREELVGEEGGLCEFFAAMNDAMRHDTHFAALLITPVSFEVSSATMALNAAA